jgi:hypothetical protein
MTSEGEKMKDFDNGTQRFAQELQTAGITIGSAFTITRTGVQTKTRYTVSDVVNPVPTATMTAPAVAQVAPVAEAAPVAAAVSTTAQVAP